MLSLARLAQKKWGPALLPAPTAPSEGSAGLKDISRRTRHQSPGSPAQASLPTVPLPRERSLENLLDCAARKLACLSTSRLTLGSKQSDVLRPFLGRPLSRPALLFPPERVLSRVALEEDQLFRRPLPVGGDRSFNHPPLPSCRCRPSGGGGDFRPDHLLTMHLASESGK
jgi:hypothetical protein